MKTSRRQFMIMSAAGACSIALSNTVQAQAMVAETDPQAVNKAKFPKYAAGQVCSNCALYQGSGPTGGCSLFGAKKVAGAGWCSAWAKKA
jgi:hypothetical protein